MTEHEELRATALETLTRAGGEPRRALSRFAGQLTRRRPLLDALALDYLTRLAADAAGTLAADAEPGPGVAVVAPPAPTIGAIKVKGARPHRRRTSEQIQAERAVWLMGADAIYESRRIDNRAIGDLPWRELEALVREHARDAVSYLRLGTEATENAVILRKIKHHAVAADAEQRVRDVVSSKQLQTFIEEARAEAPRLIEHAMRLAADQIQRGQIDHDAA